MKKRFSLDACSALVTGATAGLGAEIARQLAPRARCLILTGRRGKRLRALAESLAQDHPSLKIHSFVADLSLPEERERLASFIAHEDIPLNLLVNNAGLGDLGSFDSSEWSRLQAMLWVNVEALTHLTRRLLSALQANASSAVLNVSSIAGFFPLPEMAVYAATKAYVTSFSEALRMELAPRGIGVTALCPGPVPTEFFEVAAREGKPVRAIDRSPSFFQTSPEQVVLTALKAVEGNRPSVIPNRLLAAAVHVSRLMPFPLLRAVIRFGAGLRRRNFSGSA